MISESKQRKVGVMLEYINIFSKLLIGVIYTPLMLTRLGQNEYGIYSLCAAFTGYLTLFNSGINAAYIRYYVQTKVTGDDAELAKLNGLFLKVLTFLAIVVFTVGLFFTYNIRWIFGENISSNEYNLSRVLLCLMVINTCINIVNGAANSIIVANERFIFIKVVNLFGTVIVPVFTIPLLLLGYGSIGIMVMTVVASSITFIVNTVYCRNKIGVKFNIFSSNRILLFSILSFSVFIFLQSCTDQLMWEINKILLARFKGADAVAVYSVGNQLNSYYMLISGSVVCVFIAQANKMVADGDKDDELSLLFVKISRIIFMLSTYVLIGYIFLGKAFIKIWAGSEYTSSYYVALLMMVPLTVSLTQQMGQVIMRAKNKHKLQTILNGTVCFLNLFVSIPLCRIYGVIGAGIGTCIASTIICVIIPYIYYGKVGKINMKYYLQEMKSFIPAIILPCIVGLIIFMSERVNDIKTFIFYGLIYSMVYALSIWKLGMNTYERQLILSLIRRRR